MATDYQVVLCTVPDAKTGEQIGRALVGEALAACVNVVPGLSSIYRWKQDVMQDSECLLVIKTRDSLFEAVQKRIQALHPYELPEVVAVPIVAGSAAYLNWIDENTHQ